MTTVRDPEILYAAFTQHIRRCPDCAVQTDLCPAAREFLHAWGEAEKVAHAARLELERAQYEQDYADEGGRPDYDALRETYDL